eukprot:gene26402-35045_t
MHISFFKFFAWFRINNLKYNKEKSFLAARYQLFLSNSRIADGVPNHVAFIVDGNGRWASRLAEKTGAIIERSFGHTIGANVTVNIVKKTFELGVQYVTLFLFSTENWSRPENEVSNILNLLNKYLLDFSSYLKQEKIQLRVIGQKNRLPEYTQYLLDTVGYNLRSSTSKDNNISVGNEDLSGSKVLCLAISYGGRSDIVESCRTLAARVARGELAASDIDEELFAKHTQLGCYGIPDPDLLVRTSGEHRLSNFLLWNCAYTEFETVSSLWPDFTVEEVEEIIARFPLRKRRFGGLPTGPSPSPVLPQ